MDTLQLKNVVKTLKKTELVFQLNDGRLRIGKADIRWETIDNNGTPDERIIITPEIQERDYRVNFSSSTLDKQGASNAQELVEFWEANNFFFDIGQQPIADGRVEFRADLPITIGFPPVGSIFIVEKPTLILGIWKQFTSGYYIKDTDTGSLNDWRKFNKKSRFTTDEFRIFDAADQTKQIAFDASSQNTGTTKILPIQDLDYSTGLIEDAPNDGNLWLRKTKSWDQLVTPQFEFSILPNPLSTTSTVFQLLLSHDFVVAESNSIYNAFVNFAWKVLSISQSAEFDIRIDTVSIFTNPHNQEPSDVAEVHLASYNFITDPLSAGNHNISIFFRKISGAALLTAQDANINIDRKL